MRKSYIIARGIDVGGPLQRGFGVRALSKVIGVIVKAVSRIKTVVRERSRPVIGDTRMTARISVEVSAPSAVSTGVDAVSTIRPVVAVTSPVAVERVSFRG